jgi:DNA ligase-1
VLLADVVATSQQVASTRSRKAKVDALAQCLSAADLDELETVVAYLSGSLRQRRTGLGWRSLTELPAPALAPQLEVAEVDSTFEEIAALAGPGSRGRRDTAVATLFAQATAAEQQWLRSVVTGNVRQGALESVVVDAVARATGIPLAAVRRAAMLTGSPRTAAVAAFSGGEAALARLRLDVGRPVSPMLAGTAADVSSAFDKVAGGREVAVDAKLDGTRIQVHRDGDEVLVATRSLDDITGRLPEVVELARSLAPRRFVLDGEALSLAEDGTPRPFQETASRMASREGTTVTPFFFDLLHLDGDDLLDAPARERFAALDALVPTAHRVARLLTADPAEADAFTRRVLAAGHEGVVVKSLEAPYEAGRRGSGWVKVKPVHTLDLVVLAVEHGSGRRRGHLSNIHLGARNPDGTFSPVGKTFKGMTDATLAWQTTRFRQLQVDDDGWVVTLRPEQVVEIAFDGVQRSTRYPGGVALRFARVVRYRDDKSPQQADTIDAVRAHLP